MSQENVEIVRSATMSEVDIAATVPDDDMVEAASAPCASAVSDDLEPGVVGQGAASIAASRSRAAGWTGWLPGTAIDTEIERRHRRR